MADTNRPTRPAMAESLLLDTLPDFSRDECDAVEALCQYMDDLEAYANQLECDVQESDEMVDNLLGTLGETQRKAEELEAESQTLKAIRSERDALRSEVASQARTIQALGEAMGETERQQWEERLQSAKAELEQGIKNRDETIRAMSNELVFFQTQLGGIRLILR